MLSDRPEAIAFLGESHWLEAGCRVGLDLLSVNAWMLAPDHVKVMLLQLLSTPSVPRA